MNALLAHLKPEVLGEGTNGACTARNCHGRRSFILLGAIAGIGSYACERGDFDIWALKHNATLSTGGCKEAELPGVFP